MAATTGGPMVRLGTKCPSITSTWSRSASSATVSMASASEAKSAERIDGAMRITTGRSLRTRQGQQEHAVGTGRLRQQPDATPSRRPRGPEPFTGVEFRVPGGQPVIDAHRLVMGERADAVDKVAAGAQQRGGAVEQLPLQAT